MSKVCSLCGKRPVSGQNVSHSKRRTKRRFLPNLVSKRFGGVKVQICTSCLRTLKKPERVKQSAESEIKKVEEKKVEIKAEKKKEKKSSSKK
ncbi:50S ribosomal protein L28 [Candidatus Gracilibacteria bacterium]|nr:50S ribosomal protein L28 [Candidatus Gracilibacteria bacterium]